MDDAMIEEKRTSEPFYHTWKRQNRCCLLLIALANYRAAYLAAVESCQEHTTTIRSRRAESVDESEKGRHRNALHEASSAPNHPSTATSDLPWDHPMFPIPSGTNKSQEDTFSRGLAFASSSSSSASLVSPKYHTRQPDAFRLCGTSSPTLHEKTELGLANAVWDAKGARSWNSKQGLVHSRPQAPPSSYVFSASANTSNATASTIVIPVWFHVLQWDDTWGKLTTKQIEDLFMAALESAYSASTPFSFQLKGVTTTIHRKWYYCRGQNRYKKRLRKGGRATLNVYVCDMVGSLEMGGDAYFPYVVRNAERSHLDGIRIMNPALGGAHYAAQALVHEVGHYLGLLHTFEGGCETDERYHYGRYPGYYFAGDGVRDTPAQAMPTLDLTPNSTCWREDRINTCRDRRRSNGVAVVDPGRDLVSNYMNYLSATCYYWYGSFTPGQVDRMVAQYEMYRKSL